MTRYTVTFDTPEATMPEYAGGKGANLAILTQAGFAVPSGFIVTADAYREFMATFPDMTKHISALPLGQPEKLVAATEKLREILSKQPLPETVEAEVRAALKRSGDGAYSVRSSSTFEDMAGAAFAGQHDTYLNCSGEDEILGKIRDCFVSLWQDRAVAYRHSKGFNRYEATMAVVVQKMVQCDVAGVGFTIDPISGRDAMLINANYGLGESVVGGETEVDQYVVERKTKKLAESFIAHKTVKIVSNKDKGQGTLSLPLNGKEAEQPVLAEEQINALCDLMLKVEQLYRFPQDIEWGMEKGTLYLLQSRPVTTFAPRWTRDESAERYPSVITPLSWDLVEEGFHKSIEHSFQLMGLPPFDGKWFALFDNYVYGNQTAARTYLGMLPFAPADEEELRMGMTAFAERYNWALTLPSEWMRELDRYLMNIGVLKAESLDGKSPAEIWSYVVKTSVIGGEYFKPNIAISITQSVLYRSLLQFIKIFMPDNALEIFDHITAYCETKTSLVNRQLKALASIVRSDTALAAKMNAMPSKELILSKELDAYPVFSDAFARFLEDHGHREIEFDPYIPTWFEAPWVVLDNIRLILNAPIENTAKNDLQIKRAASEAESKLFSSLPPEFHLFFREIIRLVRLYTELDDIEHYQTTRLHLPMRKGLLALGKSLMSMGVLQEPSDIFFARKTSIETCANAYTSWNALTGEIRAAKATYEANKKRTPEWVLGEKHVQPEHSDKNLVGLAGSPGVAEGHVFIINSSDDFASFPHGAVLVARTTNPAWTPLFYAASALITESGGPLSHGAVTAREMKIPAVMSVRGVLAALKNGDKVKVDGSNGVVYMQE